MWGTSAQEMVNLEWCFIPDYPCKVDGIKHHSILLLQGILEWGVKWHVTQAGSSYISLVVLHQLKWFFANKN